MCICKEMCKLESSLFTMTALSPDDVYKITSISHVFGPFFIAYVIAHLRSFLKKVESLKF